MVTIPHTLTINSDRLKQDFEDLAQIGALPSGGVSRIALSKEDLEARSWFANRIEAAGLRVHDDEVGNLSGILPSDSPNAKTFLMGSHLDTVQEGGHYDGTIGVLAALECLRTVKDAELELPVHLEAINFTDEEGSWQSFFGSLGLTGRLEPHHIDDSEMDNGAFRIALHRVGIRPSEVNLARRQPERLAGYLELHIEQSERLHQTNKQIGIVTGIVGRSTYNFVFRGEATHAATTSPEKRRDALQGAAIFITEMHRLVRDEYPEGIVNCGNVHVLPGTFNVVPSQASLRLEARHLDETTLAEMEARLIRLAHDCAKNYGLTVSIDTTLKRPATVMNQQMIETIEDVCQAQGRSYMHLRSLAGHDAQLIGKIAPSAMIFVPSVDGVSHNPREFTEWHDIEAGANVMLHTMLQLVG